MLVIVFFSQKKKKIPLIWLTYSYSLKKRNKGKIVNQQKIKIKLLFNVQKKKNSYHPLIPTTPPSFKKKKKTNKQKVCLETALPPKRL